MKDYYGKVLNTSKDLKTNACTSDNTMPDHVKAVLRKVNSEVIAKYYGCGICIPDELEGYVPCAVCATDFHVSGRLTPFPPHRRICILQLQRS